MGLFRCKYCEKVFTSAFQSAKRDLCRNCYMKLEDLYSRSRIHDYIRDHGLKKGFDIDELARELGINPKNIKALYDLGFFDRDIQVYSNAYNRDRKKLAEEFRGEIEKIKKRDEPEEKNFDKPKNKLVSYNRRLYNRRTF